MHAVVEQIATARPDLDVRLAFLDLNAPSVDQIVDAVAADGYSHAVVVPLLLGSAFHARVDLPGMLAAARTRNPRLQLTQANVLGPDSRLLLALQDRVLEAVAAVSSDHRNALPDRAFARHSERIGIAVAAVGSSSPTANARTAQVAHRLSAITGWPTEICFATTTPTVTEAISTLHTRGADRVLIAPWFLAPGLLTDRLMTAAPNLLHANTIGPHPLLADVVLDRYTAAIAQPLELSA
ncbi:sirohydrochlorin chelatase [Nocardia sp. NPDC051030]|uniref:sirohydrochlorin chelatase n=1 Tax=Nocardia sp. NPDC051030 TaxID=3155162 RepID=UPI0034180BA3